MGIGVLTQSLLREQLEEFLLNLIFTLSSKWTSLPDVYKHLINLLKKKSQQFKHLKYRDKEHEEFSYWTIYLEKLVILGKYKIFYINVWAGANVTLILLPR